MGIGAIMKKYILETSGFIVGSNIEIRENSSSSKHDKILYVIKKNPFIKAGLFLIAFIYNRVNYTINGMNGNKDLKIKDSGFNKHIIFEDNIQIGNLKGKGFKLLFTRYRFNIVINEVSYFFESDTLFPEFKVYCNKEIVGKIKCIKQPQWYPHFGKTDWSGEFDTDTDIRVIAIGLLYAHLIWFRAFV